MLLTGCEFSFGQQGEPITISGYVTFEQEPLAGVSIISDFMTLTTTNTEGYYSFTTYTSNLSFYAKKSGYSFLPKNYNSENVLEEYNFEAIEATLLNGKLVLSEILFTPTSISNLIDNNYAYEINSIYYLKISEFVLKFNQEIVADLTQTTFLEQNKSSNIFDEGDNALEIQITNGVTNYIFEYQIKTFFKYNNNQNESVSVEPFKVLRVLSTLYDGDLNEQNQIVLFASGSSTHNGFSYNLQFVFNYVK